MTDTRNRNTAKSLLSILGGVLLSVFALTGCGGGGGGNTNNNTPGQQYNNYHPTGWIYAHGGQAVTEANAQIAAGGVAGVDSCNKCHAGSSGVPTCMTTGCHHQSTPGFSDPTAHGARAKMASNAIKGGSLVSCQICHAKAFTGGNTGFACSSCHSVQAPHSPKPWRTSGGSAFTHTTTDPSNAPVCAQCHYFGSPNNPANHPAAAPAAGAQPGCYNATLCHGAANVAPHPVPFLSGNVDSSQNGHMTATAATFASDCGTCHAYSGTSPSPAAPLCNACHKLADPTASGTNAGTCLSCHSGPAGLPDGPTGSGFPSIAGAHAKHMNLGTQLTCDTCHAGAGTGSTTHYANANGRIGTPTGPATVSIDATFKAKSGGNPAFTASSLTCSNVSCHGGQATPGWQNGTINSNTQCTACHNVAASAGATTQFNDAFGRHSMGTHNAMTAANSIACTTCHNMNNGSAGALAHFKYLNTPAVDGTSGTPADQLPSTTIVFDTTVVSGAATYTVPTGKQGDGGCALTCHTHVHTAAVNTWTSGGAPHGVPFLTGATDTQGNGHMNATAATFSADCASCHAYSGTSPSAAAPLCNVCHTAADPTVASTGAGTCLSCHSGASGLPAGPTGTAFPSIAGAHAKHMGLPTALTCNTCHTGAGTGTTTHYTNANGRVSTPTGPATVSIDSTYNAQTGGPATFTASSMSCGATSCHGGKATPNWRTGTINSTTQCSSCHAVNGGTTNAQYNDATGRHASGTHAQAAALDCTICHDMSSANTNAGATKHFAELNTSAFGGSTKLPSGTIKFTTNNGTYPITGAATYDVTTAPFKEGDGGCALTCHSQVHVPANNHWAAVGGAAHPIPFVTGAVSSLGNPHQTVTLTQFNNDCASCHDQSGTSTKTGPVCTVCHTKGSPLATGMGNCLSCHEGASFKTTGPTGTAWPNAKGAHAKHTGLLTFTRTTPALPASLSGSAYPVCQACHTNALPGDSGNTHYSNANKRLTTPVSAGPAPVTIDATFKAQAGAISTVASASAFTCSNVSCHGAQTTPGWQSGTLTVNTNTYCRSCHAENQPKKNYNDADGTHLQNGTHSGAACSVCHNMTNGSQGATNHWLYLDTTAVYATDQKSSDTIQFDGTTTATGGTYTPKSTLGSGNCTVLCHSGNQSHNGDSWSS